MAANEELKSVGLEGLILTPNSDTAYKAATAGLRVIQTKNHIKELKEKLKGLFDTLPAETVQQIRELEQLIQDGEKQAEKDVEDAKAAVRSLYRATAAKGTVEYSTTQFAFSVSPGRKLWDDKMLQGFALTHPEIKQACRDGEPVVKFSVVNLAPVPETLVPAPEQPIVSADPQQPQASEQAAAPSVDEIPF